MSYFVNQTIADIRKGRETWRVFIAFGVPSFVVAFGVALAQLGN